MDKDTGIFLILVIARIELPDACQYKADVQMRSALHSGDWQPGGEE